MKHLKRVRSTATWAVKYKVLPTLGQLGFTVLGPARVQRGASRLSLRVESLTPPTPADVLGNYVRGIVLFGEPLTPAYPFRWRSVPNRAVITRATARVPQRIRRIQRRTDLEIRFDVDFDTIVEACRVGRTGWLTPEVVELYRKLHDAGFVATIGAYRDDTPIAGLWGLELGGTLGIMSLFHTEDHSGTVVTAAAVDLLLEGGRWTVLDCGDLHANYERYGAALISREHFCELVARGLTPGGSESATTGATPR